MGQEDYEGFFGAVWYSLKREPDPSKAPEGIRKWADLMELAEQQNLLPLLAEPLLSCPAALSADPSERQSWKRRAMTAISVQIRRTQELLALLHAFKEAGLSPLVVKGIVCRSLYPDPDLRPSSDEDLVIEADRWETYDSILASRGYRIMNTEKPEEAHEISYASPGSFLHLELHKTLFPPDQEIYGSFNRFFLSAAFPAGNMLSPVLQTTFCILFCMPSSTICTAASASGRYVTSVFLQRAAAVRSTGLIYGNAVSLSDVTFSLPLFSGLAGKSWGSLSMKTFCRMN